MPLWNISYTTNEGDSTRTVQADSNKAAKRELLSQIPHAMIRRVRSCKTLDQINAKQGRREAQNAVGELRGQVGRLLAQMNNTKEPTAYNELLKRLQKVEVSLSKAEAELAKRKERCVALHGSQASKHGTEKPDQAVRLSARVLRVKKRKNGKHRLTTKVAQKPRRVGVAA